MSNQNRQTMDALASNFKQSFDQFLGEWKESIREELRSNKAIPKDERKRCAALLKELRAGFVVSFEKDVNPTDVIKDHIGPNATTIDVVH